MDDSTKQIIFHIATKHNSVVILDVSYHLHRFAYVFRNLSIDNDGVMIPTGHIYGFLRMIAFLRRKFGNPAIICAVDGYDKERKAENPNYKANREASENSIHGYTDDIIKMSGLMGGVYVSYNGSYEADDTIHNIARNLDTLFKKNSIDRNIYIYTQDKDLYQTVNDKIFVVKKWGEGKGWLDKAELVGETQVREAFHGVSPDKLAIFRSIAGGDNSDNISGYLRFPKKIASVIAEKCVIAENSIVCNEEELRDEYPKLGHYLSVINNDFEKFRSNYKIMKMKEYDFTLRIPDTTNAQDKVRFYKMSQYTQELQVLAGVLI